MRKLATFAALAITTLGFGLQTHAAPVVYDLDTSTGGLFGSEQSCTQVILTFNTEDCTYGAVRQGETFGFWQGPASNGGFFNKTGTGSDISYDSNNIANNKINEITVHFLAGSTVTIEDNGTPCDTDDQISATWIFGPAARNVATGNGRRAVETWDSVTHTMAPTKVTKATPNASGGCDYEISTPPASIPGAPSFPPRICAAADPTDCYPSVNAASGLGTDTFWAGAAGAGGTKRAQTTGIERAPLMGANTAASTTGVIANYTCVANVAGSGDCIPTATVGPSPILWGVNPTGATGPPLNPGGQSRAPGFSNVVLRLSTDNSGAKTRITDSFAYYTRELKISLNYSGTSDNSWQGGAFSFTGTGPFVGGGAPTARDDTAQVKFNTTGNVIDVLANDSGFKDPLTVTITVPPAHGTAVVTVSGTPSGASGTGAKASIRLSYAPTSGYTGSDSLTYSVDDGTSNGTAVVSITVSDLIPLAQNFGAGDTFSGAPVTKDVTTIAGVALGDPPNTVSLNPATDQNATCSVAGNLVTVAPISASFTGTSACGYTITDVDGESSSAVVSVNAIGRQPVAVDDSASTVVNTPTAPIDVIANDTLGNGTAAEHVVTIVSDAIDGKCSVVDQKVVYTPDAKFSGDDSCTYQLADSKGLVSTATVHVKIDLALPGGGSSLDAASLGALLAGLPVAARRRRRKPGE